METELWIEGHGARGDETVEIKMNLAAFDPQYRKRYRTVAGERADCSKAPARIFVRSCS
jgi:hypothetical protein